jgi:uncharacterized protein YkwD
MLHRHTATHTSTSLLRRLLPMLALISLASCGGGSGGSSTPAAQPLTLSSAAAGHFNRFNEFRACAGLAPLGFDSRLASAAQAHSDYLRLNNSFAHTETPSAPGFYGAGITDRIDRSGYAHAPGALQSETLVGGSPDTQAQGRDLADVLLGSPSHRFTILSPDFTHIGVAGNPLVSDFAAPQTPAASQLVLFPCDGLAGVNTLTSTNNASFAVDPTAPGARDGAVGYPLSLTARLFSTFRYRAPWLRSADGASIALKCANPETESVSAVLCASAAPLAANTAYEWGVEIQSSSTTWTARSARFVTGPF